MQYPDNLYETLGLQKFASSQEVKLAFRRMALKYHPDKNPGDTQAEETFKKINAAYQILENPQSKLAYDNFLKNGDLSRYFQTQDTKPRKETREERQARVREVKRKQKAKEEQELLQHYQRMIDAIPLKYRFISAIPLYAIGSYLLFAYSYLNEYSDNTIGITIGCILLIVANMYFFDLLYRKWRVEYIRKIIKKNPEHFISSRFLIVLIGIFTLVLSASFNYKKFMLENYSIECVATVTSITDQNTIKLRYQVNGRYFVKPYYLHTDYPFNRGDQVKIKYLPNNPRICKVTGLHAVANWHVL